MRINIKHQIEKAPLGGSYVPVTDPANGELQYTAVSTLFTSNSTSSGVLHQSIAAADVTPLTDTEISDGFATVTVAKPFVGAYPTFIVPYLNGIMTSGLVCTVSVSPLITNYIITVIGLDAYANTDWNLEVIIQWTKP